MRSGNSFKNTITSAAVRQWCSGQNHRLRSMTFWFQTCCLTGVILGGVYISFSVFAVDSLGELWLLTTVQDMHVRFKWWVSI